MNAMIRTSSFVFAAALASLGTGCFEPSSTACKSGIVCPAGSRCSADGTTCTRTACGNGTVEGDEKCDDGNVASNDGCRADCASDERCGNDVTDPLKGELCDDGNTTSGDGCSADCTSVEWSNVCSALPVLQLDTKLSGNVDGGTSYFDSSGLCAYQSGRERAWTWTASATGKLQLSLESASNLDVFVLSECTAVSPEKLAQCANSGQASQTEAMDVAVSAGQKLTVVVQGHSQDDGGAFVLSAKLVP